MYISLGIMQIVTVTLATSIVLSTILLYFWFTLPYAQARFPSFP